MADLIILGGAPGSGKTTIGELLKKEKGFPCFDLGWLRQAHLDDTWSNTSKEEEEMALEDLDFVIRNYFKHGYKNVIINDLEDDRIGEIVNHFKDKDVMVFSLFINNEEELKKRVLGERDSGFKNVEAALEWNRKLIARDSLPTEIKIDNTHNNPSETVLQILKVLSQAGSGAI